ncbi:50S ribosomal protein L19e [uncultured archaeon]|nr:50S ribosomal protein L19e [uncultured archaeon]
MNLTTQKRLAADILNCGENRVWIDPEQIGEVGGAITKDDVRRFIVKGFIKAKPKVGTSSARAKVSREQKKKGRQRGPGKRRGKKTARTGKKEVWMKRIRSIRKELAVLREVKKITRNQYSKLYKMAGSGLFKDKANLHLQVSKFKEAESVKKKEESK